MPAPIQSLSHLSTLKSTITTVQELSAHLVELEKWRASNPSPTNVTLDVSGTTPNPEAATISGSQVLQLQTGNGTYAGLMSPAQYTKLANMPTITTIGAGLSLVAGTLSATVTSYLTLGASQTTPNASAATLVSNVLRLQTADATFAGLMSPANYTKLTSLQAIYTIGTGLSLVSNTLSNTGLLGVTTFDLATSTTGFSVSSQLLSLSAATESRPGGVSAGAQNFGGPKTFWVDGTNTVLATLSGNELRIDGRKGVAPEPPALKLLTAGSAVAQLISTTAGDATLEGLLSVGLKAAAFTSFSVDGSGAATIFDAGSGATLLFNAAGSGKISNAGTVLGYDHNNEHQFFISGVGKVRVQSGALVPFSSASITLGSASNPWGNTFVNGTVTSTNANINTTLSPTPQVSLVATGVSGIPLMLFTGNATVRGHIWGSTTGNMAYNAVGGAHVWFNNGTATMNMTPTDFKPNVAAGLTLGTSALPWGQAFFNLGSGSNGPSSLSTNDVRFENTNTTTGTQFLKFTFGGTQKSSIGSYADGTLQYDVIGNVRHLFTANANTTNLAHFSGVAGLGFYGTINTTAGTSATVNKFSGRNRLTGTTFTVTNSYVTTNSEILVTANTAIAAGVSYYAVPGSGSFTVTFTSSVTNVDFSWLVIGAL